MFSFICCIYGLFFNALSGSDYIAYNLGLLIDDENERTWEAVIMACFKVLFCQSPRFVKEDRNFQSGSFVPKPRFEMDASQIQGISVSTEDILFGLCSHCHGT